MLRNYFEIALRNLRKHVGFSVINVAGVAIGLACFLLIALYINDERSYRSDGQIIGVTKDYHFESLHQRVSAIAIVLSTRPTNWLWVPITGNITAGVQQVEAVWKRFFPERPFDYQFLYIRFDRLYTRERTQQTLFSVFSGVAILISCLGLFGLSMFMAEQRTKEIGIRKILGASEGSLVALFSKDFMKLVIIALVLASPIA